MTDMSEKPTDSRTDGDFAGELTDEKNDLMADLKFEQMLSDAAQHRPEDGRWRNPYRPKND